MSAGMDAGKERILEIIKKCLALGDAERNPNEHEVENALRQAHRLMEQHNLSMADVAFSEANVGKIREEGLRPRAGIPRWETALAKVCDNLFGTEHFLSQTMEKSKYATHRFSGEPKWQDRTIVTFYGYDTDVALSVEVYKLLKLEILEMARRWEKKDAQENPHCTPGQLRGRRFAYCDGVVWAIRAKSANEPDGLSKVDRAKVNALVVRKNENLKAWAEQQHPDLTPVRRWGTSAHEDAQFDGNNDGRKMSLKFRSTVNGSSADPLRLGHKSK